MQINLIDFNEWYLCVRTVNYYDLFCLFVCFLSVLRQSFYKILRRLQVDCAHIHKITRNSSHISHHLCFTLWSYIVLFTSVFFFVRCTGGGIMCSGDGYARHRL